MTNFGTSLTHSVSDLYNQLATHIKQPCTTDLVSVISGGCRSYSRATPTVNTMTTIGYHIYYAWLRIMNSEPKVNRMLHYLPSLTNEGLSGISSLHSSPTATFGITQGLPGTKPMATCWYAVAYQFYFSLLVSIVLFTSPWFQRNSQLLFLHSFRPFRTPRRSSFLHYSLV